MASVGIIGAGIAGLTAAFHLHTQGVDIAVLEASGRAGGKIHSARTDSYLIEHGPNTVQRATPLMDALIERLGLADTVVEAHTAVKKRYVVRDGRPHPLPTAPPRLFTSKLFSFTAKLRLLGEPFVRPAAPDVDESVADFARRRLGPEILNYGLNPFVGGIFAGDPEQLSLRHAFERLHALEQQHGSLFKGFMHSMRARRNTSSDGEEQPARRMFSFRDGMQMLPDALAERLGAALHLRTPVVALKREGTRWILTVRRDGEAPTTHTFDAIISAVPLHCFAAFDFEAGVDSGTVLDRSLLADVPYPPVGVVAMGFRRDAVDHPLDGFGMLVPEVEDDYRILGTLFSSTLFPDRTPEGHVLLTTFVGGARDPALGRAPSGVQRAAVLSDLQALLGVRGAPAFVQRVVWPHAIPQYVLGYGRVKALIDRIEQKHPCLFLTGNYRQGVSIGDTMDSGHRTARRVVEALGR